MTDEDDPTDIPFLSSEALLALQEFYSTKEVTENLVHQLEDHQLLKVNELEENWQLSQFWYDDQTAQTLCTEALSEIDHVGKVALIGCPSLYYFFQQQITDSVSVKLLDVDKRFAAYKDDFVCYDYNLPILSQLPNDWKNTFDVVIIDPPFLSEECFIKCAMCAKFLAKEKIIVCTGAIMETFVKRTLNAKKTDFEPRHKHNLANEFCCFVNYQSKRLRVVLDEPA